MLSSPPFYSTPPSTVIPLPPYVHLHTLSLSLCSLFFPLYEPFYSNLSTMCLMQKKTTVIRLISHTIYSNLNHAPPTLLLSKCYSIPIYHVNIYLLFIENKPRPHWCRKRGGAYLHHFNHFITTVLCLFSLSIFFPIETPRFLKISLFCVPFLFSMYCMYAPLIA